MALVARSHADGGHVCFVRHAPYPRISDDDAALTEHQIERLPVLRELTRVRVSRPRRQKYLALDLLDRRDVVVTHALDGESRDNLHLRVKQMWPWQRSHDTRAPAWIRAIRHTRRAVPRAGARPTVTRSARHGRGRPRGALRAARRGGAGRCSTPGDRRGRNARARHAPVPRPASCRVAGRDHGE